MKFYDLKKSLLRTQKPQSETLTEIPEQQQKKAAVPHQSKKIYVVLHSAASKRCVGRNLGTKQATTTLYQVAVQLHTICG